MQAAISKCGSVGLAFALVRMCTMAGIVSAAPLLPAAEKPTGDQDPSTRIVVIRIPQKLINTYLSPTVEEETPVSLVVLGANVNGNARVNGELLLDTKPDNQVRLLFRGTALARTTGREGPAIIHSTARTTFTATKQLIFTTEGVETGDTQVTVDVDRQVQSIQSTAPGLRGRLVKNVANRRLQRLAPQIDAVAHRNAEQRIRHSFDQRVEQLVQSANDNRNVWGLFGELLATASERDVKVTTTEDCLQLAWVPDDDVHQSLAKIAARARAVQNSGATSDGPALTVWYSPPLTTVEEAKLRLTTTALQQLVFLLGKQTGDTDQKANAFKPSPVHVARNEDWTFCWIPWEAAPAAQAALARRPMR